jgi:hypothetical protein
VVVTVSYGQRGRGEISQEACSLHWEDCEEQIDVVSLASKEPILFYDEVRILIPRCRYVLFQEYVSMP